MQGKRWSVLLSMGLMLLVFGWLQPVVAGVLVPFVVMLLLPSMIHLVLSRYRQHHSAPWLVAVLVLGLLPVLLPVDQEEQRRRCSFGGTTAQTQTCLAARRADVTRRLAIYWTCLAVVSAGSYVVSSYRQPS